MVFSGNNDNRVASSINHTLFKTRVQKSNPKFMTKMAKIDTLFMTKTAENPFTLGPHIPI